MFILKFKRNVEVLKNLTFENKYHVREYKKNIR